MKLLILGHGEHGKDDVAELLYKKIGLTYQSSSFAAAEKAVYPVLKDQYGYASVEECFNDRRNHRGEWKRNISAYNNPAYRLASEILEESDVYIGMRDLRELRACQEIELFDLILTVDAFQRMPGESSESINIDVRGEAHYILDNNGALSELDEQVNKFVAYLYANGWVDESSIPEDLQNQVFRHL